MKIGAYLTRRNWKRRIIFALSMGGAYALTLYLIDYFSGEEQINIYPLAFQGLLFGAFMEILVPYVTRKIGGPFVGSQVPSLAEGEHLEEEGSASLLSDMETVGGTLFLTNKRFLFQPYKFNIQSEQKDFLWEEISEVSELNNSKSVDQAIRILTKEGKSYDFTIREDGKWMEKLKELTTL